MSRGVSCATGSVWVFYLYPHKVGEDSRQFGKMEEDWDDFVDNLRGLFQYKFPSLQTEDRWLGREDRAILKNGHAYIGLSEYCGTVCVWCVPVQRDGYGLDNQAAHDRWCARIEGTVRKTLEKAFPDEMLVNLGCASNGEQFFRPLKRPGGIITTKEGVLF